MKVYSFPHGGLVYNDPTAPQKSATVNAFLPSISVIHLGYDNKKSYSVVYPGETVKEGMLVGRSAGTGTGTVNVHATVPGRVIKKISWNDSDNLNNEALVIKTEGAFERLGKKEEVFPWNNINGYDLQKMISECGVVEMENYGEPLSEMISLARKEDKITLVIRCVFDDPWLVADYALCRDRINAVIEGAFIVAKACLKVSRIIIAISHTEKELGQMLLSEAKQTAIPLSIVLTSSRYPQRSKRELEIALRMYEKKENLNLGSFLILGPAVLAAVFDAVVYKKPVLERYVAVGGSAVKEPQIMKVRIGTRIGELIEQCGGFSGKPDRIVTGSPISGKEVMYLDEPVVKTCYAIAAMTASQTKLHKPENCINCGECRAVCPAGLDPQYIYKLIKLEQVNNALSTGCQGCGCCKVVCPSALPLLETIFERNQG